MAGNTLALGISNAGPVASIVNGFSAGGNSTTSVNASANVGTVEVQAAGAYTANTLQTVITHAGRGRLNVLSVYARNATPRTLRCRITVDGTVVFDATSGSVSATNSGIVPVGIYSTSAAVFQPIDYNESLLIEVASSLADSASNIGVAVNRETWVS